MKTTPQVARRDATGATYFTQWWATPRFKLWVPTQGIVLDESTAAELHKELGEWLAECQEQRKEGEA